MARDWSLSRFVRLYVNESADEAAWDWQARCVWPLLIKAADRAGVIETSKGAKGLAAAIRMPLEVVAPAVDELTADGCLVATAKGYILRNYVEAQTAKMAGSQRQAEYKARERARAALDDTDCNGADAEVTRADTESHEVTAGDAEVTPRRSEKRREEREERESGKPDAGPLLRLLPVEPATPKPDPAAELAAVAVEAINAATGRAFESTSAATVKLARALVKAGATHDDVRAVVRTKAAEWVGDPRMAARVCPGTLLAAENFARYLDEARAGPAVARSTTPSQPQPPRPKLITEADL